MDLHQPLLEELLEYRGRATIMDDRVGIEPDVGNKRSLGVVICTSPDERRIDSVPAVAQAVIPFQAVQHLAQTPTRGLGESAHFKKIGRTFLP